MNPTLYLAMIAYDLMLGKYDIDPARLASTIRRVLQNDTFPLGKRSYIKLVLDEIAEGLEREEKLAAKESALYSLENAELYRLNAALGLMQCELQDILQKESLSIAWKIIQDIINELELKAYPEDSEPQSE